MIPHYLSDLLNFLYLIVDLIKGAFFKHLFVLLGYIADTDTLDVSLLYSLQTRNLR